jgi:aminopeptidase N
MKKVILGSMLVLLASCGSKKPYVEEEIVIVEEVPAPQAEEVDELELEIPPQRPVYRETETILTDLIHTKLQVNFDWEKSRMNGIAWITAKPHFYASDSLILDAKGMDINSVAIGSKELSYTYKDDYLRINLGKTYTRNDKYTVMIDYLAKPEERESDGSAAITSAKGLYFINPKGEEKNKMPQIWTQGETEASSVWFPTIDSPNAKTTQEIFITVDDKYATLSNGKLVSSKKTKEGKRVDHWKQELPHAPYLFMMAVGEFKVVKDSYKRPNGSKMEVFYYVESEWEGSAKDIFGETPEMIKYFSELLGVEYPWDKYHQIVVRDYVSGAMENTGAVIFGDFVYKNERELLDGNDQSTIAHELFHHWFGDLVTCESWSNLPLNESFANYSQYLWDEYRYGLDEAEYQAIGEADGYYQSAGMQGHHDLIWFDYDDKEQMFDGHSYNKGGRILHMLRNHLGDEAFFAGINNYLEKNKFKPAEFHQLRLSFEEVSGQDLNWFFNQWFLGSGHPSLRFTQEVDTLISTLNISVEQRQDLDLSPLYKLPFEIAIWDDNGKQVYEVIVDEVNESFSFPIEGDLDGFVYDYDQMLLAKKNIKKSKSQYIHQYYNGERYATRAEGLMRGSKDKSQKGQQLILDALADPFWHIRLLAVGKVTRLRDDNKQLGIRLVEKMAANDPNSKVRATALKTLKKFLDDDELIAIYEGRIKNDSSYSVVSSALRSLGKIDSDKAIALAEPLENEKSSKMVAGVAGLYAEYAGAEKYDFIASSLQGTVVQGFDKLGLLNSFTFYLTNQNAELIEKALPIYEDQGANGGFYMSLFLPQNLQFLTKHFNDQIKDLNKELEKHEENDDAAYADQTRREIKKYEDLLEKYSALIKRLEEGNGNVQLQIQHRNDEEE